MSQSHSPRSRHEHRSGKDREPVPGELERDEESWSGLQVTAACFGVVAVLFLGWLGWQNIVAAGWAAPAIFATFYVGMKIAEKYFNEQDEE